MDDQLANELSAIFSQCTKDPRGEVEMKKLIDALTEKYGVSEEVKEYLISKLDPDGLNEPISEERLQAVMKNIITNCEDEVFSGPVSPIHSLYTPQYSSTPNVISANKRRRNLINEVNEELSSEIHSSCIEESGNSSGITSAIQKDIIISLRAKIQELEEKLLKAEMVSNSLEIRLKKEFTTVINLKKENLKCKEELKRLQNVEEIKIEECNKVDSLEKKYKQKCNDYDKVLKQKFALEEKYSDQKSEIKALTDKLNLSMKTISEHTNTAYVLSNELAQLKRDYEQLDTDYKCQTMKLVSLEADHEVLVERITQISNEKQDLQMKLAEISVCQTITSCMNYSDVSCEVLMSLTTNEIDDKDDCSSLQKELEQRQVSLDCHSFCDSSESSRFDKAMDLTDAVAQTNSTEMNSSQYVQTYLNLMTAETQTECEPSKRFGSCWNELISACVETQTDICQIGPLKPASTAVHAQTDMDMHSCIEPLVDRLSLVSVSTQTEPDIGFEFETAQISDTDDIFTEPDTENFSVFLTPLNVTRVDESMLYQTISSDSTPWGTPESSPALSRRHSILNSYQSLDKADCSPLDSQLVLQFADCITGNELCISSRMPSRTGRSVQSTNLIPDWPYRRYVKAAAVVSALFFVILILFIILVEITFDSPWANSCSGRRHHLIWQLLQADSWVKIRYSGSPPM